MADVSTVKVQAGPPYSASLLCIVVLLSYISPAPLPSYKTSLDSLSLLSSIRLLVSVFLPPPRSATWLCSCEFLTFVQLIEIIFTECFPQGKPPMKIRYPPTTRFVARPPPLAPPLFQVSDHPPGPTPSLPMLLFLEGDNEDWVSHSVCDGDGEEHREMGIGGRQGEKARGTVLQVYYLVIHSGSSATSGQ